MLINFSFTLACFCAAASLQAQVDSTQRFLPDSTQTTSLPVTIFKPYAPATVEIILPAYTQGLFCDFEDHLNRNRKLRIDFGVK